MKISKDSKPTERPLSETQIQERKGEGPMSPQQLTSCSLDVWSQRSLYKQQRHHCSQQQRYGIVGTADGHQCPWKKAVLRTCIADLMEHGADQLQLPASVSSSVKESLRSFSMQTFYLIEKLHIVLDMLFLLTFTS